MDTKVAAAATVELQRSFSDNPTVAEIQKRNVRALKATIIGLTGRKGRVSKRSEPAAVGQGTSSGEAQGQETDTFAQLERQGKIVPPPFDPLTLSVMLENNTEIGPAIDAMNVNVESFGWKLDPRIPIDENTSFEIIKTLAEEKVVAENFFANAFQDETSLEEFREKLRTDFELNGNFWVEFVETPGSGELDGLNHLPAWTMRMSRLDNEASPYMDRRIIKSVRFREVTPDRETDRSGLEGAPDLGTDDTVEGRVRKNGARMVEEVSYEVVERIRYKRFRRYCQVVEKVTRWFKELGDPRLVSCLDGHVVTREELVEEKIGAETMPRFTLDQDRIVVKAGRQGFPVKNAANPVKHVSMYSARSPYGLPRWIGHLFCIFGSRAAEEINYTTFKNNNIPSAVITVANGQLTDESVERIQEFVEASIQSDDNYSKFLLLEAEPVMEGMRDPGNVKIEIKPLTDKQHSDALFVEYSKSNDDKVRRAWRFPPIFVGDSADWSGKTIDASRKLADEQVFQPERNRMDRFFTRDVLLRLSIVWSKFKSLSPSVTENAELVRLLAQGEKTGGLTPRISRKLIGRVVNEDLGEIDPDVLPPDQPFSLTLAQLMKSTSASDATGGGEPTSQGRAGLQVAGPGRDRSGDASLPDLEADAVERLAQAIRFEVAQRFGGFVPPAFKDEPFEDDAE